MSAFDLEKFAQGQIFFGHFIHIADVNKRVKLQENRSNGFQDIALSRETGRGGGEGGGEGGTRTNQKLYVSPERGEIIMTTRIHYFY
jgi:hypothetical protein